MKKFYFGTHYSTVAGILGALHDGYHDKCSIIQIFLSNPIGRKMRKITEEEIILIEQFLNKFDMKLVIHSPYILNLAKPFKPTNTAIKLLIREMKTSHSFSYGSVLHFGKYLDLSPNQAIINMVESIKYVLDNTPETSTLIIETSTGQGSELCYKLDEFEIFWKQFNKKYYKRLKICIDTCHIFAAGYDIRTKKGVQDYLKEFNKRIGLKHIKLVHLNDSMSQLDSNVDRHQELGKGYIGKEGLKYFILFCNKHKIPIILESHGDHLKEMKYIRQIIANK
jgi:deoxyribonuclease-4